MRGIAFRGEALGSPFICPSCVFRIASEPRAARPHQRQTRNASPSPLKKFARNHNSLASPLTSRTTSRWTSTAAYPSETPLQDAPVPEPQFMPYTSLDPARPNESIRIQSKRDHVLDVLREGQPDRVLRAFLSPWDISDNLYSLPAPAFVEAFRLLSPAYFVEPYKNLHRHFHHVVSKAKGIEPLEDYFGRFSADIWEIAHRRRNAGHGLGLAEYTHLLDCARSMGLADMAEKTWRWMAADGVEPNTECFNYYMEAILWDMMHFAKEKYNVRNTAWVLRKRSFNHRNPNWRGYKTGEKGARDQILELFDQMVSSGIQPDEGTYIHIMTASSRDAHVGSVKNILKTIWNIDVDALVSSEGEEVPPVTKLAKSSPLHPTSRLLLAVAHVFGQNNDFATALQLVDFISRQYGIKVPNRVWYELYEWAFVLSRRRWGKHKGEKSVGQIQHKALSDISESLKLSHNVPRTMPIFNMMAKVAWEDVALTQLLGLMHVGSFVFWKLQERRSQLHDLIKQQRMLLRKHTLSATIPQGRDEMKPAHIKPVHIRGYDDLLHKRDLLRIKAFRNSTYIQRWVKLILSRPKWARTTSFRTHWCHRGLPKFIEKWKLFLPTHIHYPTPTGNVDFDPSTVWPSNTRARPEDVFIARKKEPGEEIGEPEYLAVEGDLDADKLAEEVDMMEEDVWLDPGYFEAEVEWRKRNLLKGMVHGTGHGEADQDRSMSSIRP